MVLLSKGLIGVFMAKKNLCLRCRQPFEETGGLCVQCASKPKKVSRRREELIKRGEETKKGIFSKQDFGIVFIVLMCLLVTPFFTFIGPNIIYPYMLAGSETTNYTSYQDVGPRKGQMIEETSTREGKASGKTLFMTIVLLIASSGTLALIIIMQSEFARKRR